MADDDQRSRARAREARAPAAAPPHVIRRRRALALLAIGAFLAGVIVAATSGDDGDRANDTNAATAKPAPPPELPGGGRRLFPDRRIVAAYGSPRDPQLGTLGVGSLTSAIVRLEKQLKPYEKRTRPVLPALELIAVIATAAPGDGALHRERLPDAEIDRHLRAARRAKALLILDIQPGRSGFLEEAQGLERWLREPDVGLALDPEWRVTGAEVPGRVIGTTTADEVNAVSGWLAGIARARDLPQKLLLIHQFTNDMIQGKESIAARPGLAIAFNVDGFGGAPIKKAKYAEFAAQTRPGFHDGFKLFYEEDTGLMTPRQVLALQPPPDVVVYE